MFSFEGWRCFLLLVSCTSLMEALGEVNCNFCFKNSFKKCSAVFFFHQNSRSGSTWKRDADSYPDPYCSCKRLRLTGSRYQFSSNKLVPLGHCQVLCFDKKTTVLLKVLRFRVKLWVFEFLTFFMYNIFFSSFFCAGRGGGREGGILVKTEETAKSFLELK